MIREERIRLRGLLEEKRKELTALRVKADGLLISLRMLLDPYKDLEELRCDVIAEQARELEALWRRVRELSQEIARMEADLG